MEYLKKNSNSKFLFGMKSLCYRLFHDNYSLFSNQLIKYVLEETCIHIGEEIIWSQKNCYAS